MKDFLELGFRLVVGKSRISYRKDVIRRLEGLKTYYEDRGLLQNPESFDEKIAKQYDKLAELEEKEMKRRW